MTRKFINREIELKRIDELLKSKKIKSYEGRKVYCFELKDIKKALKNRY